MPAYKDKDQGTWFVKFYCCDWSGKRLQIKKRGFVTKKEALEYEKNYKARKEGDMDITFGEYYEIYKEDMIGRLKRNTWLSKEHLIRTKLLPKFLCEEMEEYFQMLYKIKNTDRLFPVTKHFLHHELDRGSKISGVKRIRVHDLRHSHVSLLINEGFTAVDIASRLGHESQEITYRYAHMFPSKQDDMADALDKDKEEMYERIDKADEEEDDGDES